MKKQSLLLFSLLYLTYADSGNMNPTVLDIHSFTLPKDRVEIRTSFYKINDTLDIFNIKEKELGSLSRFGALGDMTGYEFKLGYGISDKINLNYKYEYMKIDYGSGNYIKNKQNDIFLRFKLYSNPYTFFNAFSFDTGFLKNSSSPLDVKEESVLNSMISKILPGIPLSIHNGVINYKDTSLILYDENENKLYPFIKVGDLEDSSYYFRFILGKRFSSGKMDFYIGYKKSDITTSISIEPKEHHLIQEAIKKFDINIPNLNRDEKSYMAGVNFALEYKSFLLEGGYEYVYIDRDAELSCQKSNHIIKMSVSKIISDDLLVYIGGEILVNQFNSVIPYLYNIYTQTQFDKKYGYAKIGFVYTFTANFIP